MNKYELIGETVLYFHHHYAKKPMAGLVIDENDDGTYTVLVYLHRKPGQTFPALWVRETPTGKTGHYFKRKEVDARQIVYPAVEPYVAPELLCFITPCEGCGRTGVVGKVEGAACEKCGCGSSYSDDEGTDKAGS